MTISEKKNRKKKQRGLEGNYPPTHYCSIRVRKDKNVLFQESKSVLKLRKKVKTVNKKKVIKNSDWYKTNAVTTEQNS